MLPFILWAVGAAVVGAVAVSVANDSSDDNERDNERRHIDDDNDAAQEKAERKLKKDAIKSAWQIFSKKYDIAESVVSPAKLIDNPTLSKETVVDAFQLSEPMLGYLKAEISSSLELSEMQSASLLLKEASISTTEVPGFVADLGAYFPDQISTLERLNRMVGSTQPHITVAGKYNHSKSSLQNALIGKDVFAVADKRETISVARHMTDDAVWIDTPGLDADVLGEDDNRAWDAVMQTDILLFVHAVSEGELDMAECAWLENLRTRRPDLLARTVMVAARTDEVSEGELSGIMARMQQQAPYLPMLPVSVKRYTNGIANNMEKLVEKSGMADLKQMIAALRTDFVKSREQSISSLCEFYEIALNENLKKVMTTLEQSKSAKAEYQSCFNKDLDDLLSTGSRSNIFQNTISSIFMDKF